MKAQPDNFRDCLSSLEAGKAIDKSSNIFKLSPNLDDYDVLRINGQVQIIGRPDQVFCPQVTTLRILL